MDNVNVYDLREAGRILANRREKGNCEILGLVVGGGIGVVFLFEEFCWGILSRRYFLLGLGYDCLVPEADITDIKLC